MDVDEEEKPKKKRGKKKAKIAESEESEDEMTRNKKAARKKSLMKDSDLLKSTKDAEKEEKERRQRLEERQKEFNGLVFDEDGIAGVLDDETGTSLKRLKEIILDPDEKSDDSLPVAVHPALVKKLKLHQAEGIRFMYNCAFESIDRLDGDGSGCILAHCMGLGKTLQCVAFLHTILNHEKISKCCNRALVVVPKNVIINWGKEFAKWLWDNDDELTLDIWMLEDYKTARDRADALRDWHEGGNPGVMIIGYEMFRMLCEDESTAKPKRPGAVPKKPKKLSKAKKLQLKYLEDFQKYLLDPGPDIVICDEAHRLKNSKSALSKVMNKIRTKRRLCLTGTPLQNNLMEYHCMMDFVRRGLLGSEAEFTNRFASIINRGRSKDATSNDVRYMVRRCHVLFHHLKGVVDRRDYSVLINSIPPKQEYVLKVRLTQVQCGLYRYFLDSFMDGERKHLLADYHVLARIWSHPYNLIAHEREKERQRILKGEDEELQDFIDDDEDALTTSEESGLETDALSDATNGTDELIGKKKKKNGGKAKDDKKKKGNGRGRAKQVDEEEEEDDDEIEILEDISGGRRKTGDEQSSSEMTEMATRRSRRLNNETPELNDRDCVTPLEYQGWYSGSNLVSETDSDNYELSNKLVLLASILKKCEEIGDKILVFSQSLESLSLIKRMLAWYTATDSWFEDGHAAILKPEGETWGWYEGLDYMVIDGSVMSSKRDNVQTKFNDKDNVRTRLMLISTRAGSLGTNMVAANRVVIFDACWNPSHDTQSLFRVYRFGQEKPVYIYRLIAQGTMEEKIYKRQVVKESTSMRVVDEAQIQRHFDRKEEEELYIFEPDELNEDPDETISARPAFAPPKDRLLADVLCEYPTAIVEYMQHDTLFQHIEEEKLNDKEMEDAWAEFEREKEGRANMAIAQMQQSETYMQNMLKLQAATLGLGANALLNASDQQNQLKMQQIARQMQQNEMARRQAGLALTRVTRDAVYAAALRVPQIEPMQAVEVALLKTSLDELLPTIPERLRGGISNFQPYFMTFCQDAISKKTGGKALLDKCAATFKTVVNLVKEETVCKATLRKIYPTTAKFFPVDFQP
ncbi:hypothetical protein WR25_20771 isoform C [Diploscapter pachys]|nr:hypothetical protein WR25_20771 isoform C [Diploscapter pachys]